MQKLMQLGQMVLISASPGPTEKYKGVE